MKTKTYRDILILAFLIFAVVPACVFTSPSSPSSQSEGDSGGAVPTRNGQASSGLGSVGYTVDESRKASGTFDTNAGTSLTLMAEDANGYGWMLWIPADALMKTETITMTPFATIDTSQSEAKIISGVRLEPDGIQFVNAVQLTVNPPIDNPGVGLIFSFDQDGSEVDFAPTINAGVNAVAQIWHFSAAGYTNGAAAGGDGMDPYQKMAREEYRLALDAAKQFIKNGAPRPPASPSISMFCRGTEHNPEQGESDEFMREFLDPYDEYVMVLLGALKALELTGAATDDDRIQVTDKSLIILGMAEKTLLELGKQYQKDKPPDRLIAVIPTGLQIERRIQLINGEAPMMLIPEPLVSWAATIRDYYLDQLKTKHDYRAFPILLTLEKQVQLVGGPDRLADTMSAMTFEVIVDTSFDATWYSGEELFATGNVVQNADVKDIKNTLDPPNFLWGTANNMILKAKSGNFKDSTGSYPLAGLSDTGSLWLLNWDGCVTKSFDVAVSGLHGDGQNKSAIVAGASFDVSFKPYWWEGAGGTFIFTIPMQNLSPALGDGSFSGSGSAADGNFTSSGKIHIAIKHTPK